MLLSNDENRARFLKLYAWIKERGYMSYDVCDVTATPLYLTLQQMNQGLPGGKYLYYPFYQVYRNWTGTIRKTLGVSTRDYAQAYALIITALIRFQKQNNSEEFSEDILKLLKKLLDLHSGGENYRAWGQPYNWFSRKRIPANTPRTTVTTQAAHAFLDAYEFFHDEAYLEVARRAGNFMIDKMNWDRDRNGYVCFPYTSIDNYHIHNANVLASALLSRLHALDPNPLFGEMAGASLAFTAHHQNEDGSWYYWAPPDKILGKIDHYHTGFVLESFELARQYWDGPFPYQNELNKGFAYYLEYLFTPEMVPRMTNKSIYPVDIQSCAQALITLDLLMPRSEDKTEKMRKVYLWTLEHLYDQNQGYFYYRQYRNKTDTTPYIRWAQSWMLRAMTHYSSE